MAFGGNKEKRVLCPAGHSVREDRLPYHMVKHLCSNSVASHNPERKVMYNADKKGRKMQRMVEARNFKLALGIDVEGNFKADNPELVGGEAGGATAAVPATGPSHQASSSSSSGPAFHPQANYQGAGGGPGGEPTGTSYGGGYGTVASSGATGKILQQDHDDDEDDWGTPVFDPAK